jgi:AcrR family transcriptional regulator
MPGTSTREALVEQGALLFARRGVTGVTTRELHDAVGARNESALHYHFGGRDGLVSEILRQHLVTIEERRARLVAVLAAEDRTDDLRGLVHALAAPMAVELETPVGRARLRLVAQLSHPSLAYERPFRVLDAPAGTAVAKWVTRALHDLPRGVRRERLAALRSQLVGLFGQRAQLLDEAPEDGLAALAAGNAVFVENLLDVVVAGLAAPPSAATLAAEAERSGGTAGRGASSD